MVGYRFFFIVTAGYGVCFIAATSLATRIYLALLERWAADRYTGAELLRQTDRIRSANSRLTTTRFVALRLSFLGVVLALYSASLDRNLAKATFFGSTGGAYTRYFVAWSDHRRNQARVRKP